jgi:catechol 2,3-dioxygenase-like lactoylglutathione lyase family enzyme
MKVLSAAALSLLLSAPAFAQAPAMTEADFKGAIVGFMHAIHATNNLDTTANFYKEVFGLSSPIRPFASDGPRQLTNSPEANLRVSMLPIPGGFNFELTEFTNTPSRTLNQQAEISDPGAPHMKFLVRDIEPVMAGVKKMGLPIITSSKAPVAVKTQFGDGKAIFFRDPDGYIVEAVQIPAPADAPAGNNIGSIMGLTVRDMDADMKFWATRMGLEVSGDKKFAKDAARQDLYGIGKGGEYRTMSATFPQSKARIEFIEFKGMPRKEFSIRVTDPGASGMAIRVKQIQSLLADLKKEGIRVSSKNGELVKWSATIENVFIKDPNGLNLELVGTPAGVPAVPFPGTQPGRGAQPAAPAAPAPSTK